jgi:hypothetical protein
MIHISEENMRKILSDLFKNKDIVELAMMVINKYSEALDCVSHDKV